MDKQLLDPWGDHSPQKARPFAVGYRKNAGEPLVYGSFILGAGVLAAALLSANPSFALAGIPIMALSLWYYPMISGAPQLGANEDGLYVAPLGFVNWAAVADISLYQTSVRTMVLERVHITLNTPLPQALAKAEKVPFWRHAMLKNYRYKDLGDGKYLLDVQLHPLSGDAREIYQRLREFRLR